MAIQPIAVQDVPNVHQTQNFQPQQTESFQPVGGGTAQAAQASQPFVKEIERQVLQADEKTKAKAFEKWLGEREKGIDALMIDIERQAQQNPKLQPVVEPLKRKAQLYKQALQGIKDPEKARETLFQFADDVTKASIDAIGVKTPKELGEEAKAKRPTPEESGERSFEQESGQLKAQKDAGVLGKTGGKPTVFDKKETKKLEQAKRDEPAAVREYRNNMFRFGFSFDLQGNPKYKPTANPEAAESTIRKSLKKLNDVRASLGKPKLAFGDMIAEQDEATPGSGTGISTGTGTQTKTSAAQPGVQKRFKTVGEAQKAKKAGTIKSGDIIFVEETGQVAKVP